MQTECRIIEEPLSHLHEHAEIPIRFEVRSLYEIEGDDPETAVLVERKVDPPWIKDYDAIPGSAPTDWPKRWDISKWGLLVAYTDSRRVGGCVLAYNTDDVHRLEGREDLTVLWDLRVHPDYRSAGLGHALFDAAVRWARSRSCGELNVETQNINVPACRFYARQGCRLSSIGRLAYVEFPDEIELIWSLLL